MNIQLLIPELILAVGSFLLLLIGVCCKNSNEHSKQNMAMISHFIALIISGFALAWCAKNLSQNDTIFNQMLKITSIGSLLKSVTLFLLVMAVLISIRHILLANQFANEFLALMFLATVGGMFMISANDFIVFYTGLELQALSCYVLASFNRDSTKSSEAGIKYVILGSLASGILLYGISLVYGYCGSTNFESISTYFSTFSQENYPPLGIIFGFVLVAIGIFFKISAAPFHMWSIDVYEGSPTMSFAFFATVVKFTVISAFSIVVTNLALVMLSQIILIVALISIAVGSIGAVAQQNIKRLLAYSSVANVGFILLALYPLQKQLFAGVVIYVVFYSFISIGILSFLSIVASNSQLQSDLENKKIFNINALAGLHKTNPIIAFCLAIYFFSIAGIPPLAGFFAKFYAIKSAIVGGAMLPAIAIIAFSVVAAFYYLRIIKIIYFDEPANIIILDDFGNAKFVIVIFAIFNVFALFFIDNIEKAINSFL